MKQVIDQIINDVAELPDRSSPEDWPEAMLVTMDELRGILESRLCPAPPAYQPRNCRACPRYLGQGCMCD